MQRITLKLALASAALLLLCGLAAAQSTQVKGVINGRSGATMSVQTQDGNVTVVLTDSTKVQEPEGVFRKKNVSMAALVPGLQEWYKGSYNPQNQLVADTVTFKGSSLQTAQDIQAGLAPTQQQLDQTAAQVQEQQQQLQQQQAQLTAEQQQSAAHQAEIAANQAKIAANLASIAAANKRFGELGEYNILGEVTVLFGNGEVNVEQQYQPQLLALAKQATGITAYIIQVQGYASKVGSAAFNQKLSTERAPKTLLISSCNRGRFR